jgi:glycosyltransferase involved in cell wall biosynthesis
MKIGIITAWMRLGWGVDLTLHLTASTLKAMGHEVRLYCANHDGSYSLATYDLIHKPVVSHPFFPRFEYRARVYIPFFNQEPNDIYLIATQPFFYYPLFLKKPCVHWEFGIVPTTGFSVGQKMMWSYMRFTQNQIYHPAADHIVSISEFTKSILPPRVQRKTTPVYLGVEHYNPHHPDHDKLFPTPMLQPDPDNFGKPLHVEVPVDRRSDSELRDEFRGEIGAGKDDVVCLYVGRINPEKQPYKGTSELFSMARDMKKDHPNLKWVMVGLGDENDAKLCRDSGIIPLLNHPDWKMRKVFTGSDIYVTSSKWEGFDLPIVEAQYFGKPVIGYNIAAHPEVVKDGETGFLVNDNGELRRKLMELVSDSTLRERMGSEGRKWARKFNWVSTAEGLVGVFKRELGD